MHLLLRLLPALLLYAPPAEADVLIVDPTGTQGYSQIQAAIDAAQDGDLILVRSGTYAGFALLGRSLTVRGDVNAVVEVDGGVTVTDTPADGFVVLADLRIQGSSASQSLPAQPGENALTVLDNPGFVRVQSCSLIGGYGAPFVQHPGSPGGDACSVEGSPRTAIIDSYLDGGQGGGDPITTSFGGLGGHGLRTRTSGVVLYDCAVNGGTGGDADLFDEQIGGPGGPGCEVVDFGIFASSTTFRGGRGGSGGTGGPGSDGLVVQVGAQAQLLGCKFILGVGGNFGAPDAGPNGQPTSGGGLFSILPGEPRVCAAPGLARDGATVSVTVAGEPGDAIWIVPGQTPAHVPAIALGGVWLVARPVFLTKAPLVVLGPSGQATVELPVSALSAATPSRELFLQGFARAIDGQIRLGSPAHVSVLDCASLSPDCNGSGTFDTCDLLAGGWIDCDANSIPDGCEDDCNGNGVDDSCDVAPGGGSADENDNGVPDECDPHLAVWHVDAAAPPGGDGSAANPFRTIREGIAISLDGDTVQVADGVYAGPQNRNLVFGGRDIVVRSANGPAACVIDCEDLDNAFDLEDESAASRIEGFTIVDGFQASSGGGGIRLFNADTAILDMVFVNCRSFNGGGLYLVASNSVVSDCRFEACGAANGGGGLAITNGSPRVLRCTFLGNHNLSPTAGDGGGVFVNADLPIQLTHLTLIGNHASGSGGGLMVHGGSVSVTDSLFAGNTSPLGGAIRVRMGSFFLSDSTLAGNLAPGGAAIYASNSNSVPRNLHLDNCVAWDDPSANGSQIKTVSPGFTIRVTRCDLRGGQASVAVSSGSSLIWGAGNLDLDPLFADADGPDNNPLSFGDNDYRLGAASPCIDAGDNALVLPDAFDLDGDGNTLEPTPFDLDGLPRFVDVPGVPDTGAGSPPIVDMGAYERP